MEFILEASDETLSTHSGLGLIGLLLSKTNVYKRLSHIFYRALDIKKVPSSSTLRQRMNQIATKREDWKPIFLEEPVDLIKQFDSPITPTILSDGHTAYSPLDLDVSPFDNSNTKKEGGFAESPRAATVMYQTFVI